MKVKTADLTGPTLDWAVAKCEQLEAMCVGGVYWVPVDTDGGYTHESYAPSTNWAQGGPIIEREEISIEYNRADFKWLWTAYKLGLPDEDNPQGGPTPLVAAMRCYVASKLGDEVDTPEELK